LWWLTRGPRYTNPSVGLHTSLQEQTPLVVLIGQVGRDMFEREAFQEVDFRKMYAPLTKWVTQIERAARVPELLGRAFQTAASGRPGPVAVALPEDMLRESASVGLGDPYRVVRPSPGTAQMERLRDLLARARQPFMLVGGGGWSAQASADIMAFAEANRIAT